MKKRERKFKVWNEAENRWCTIAEMQVAMLFSYDHTNDSVHDLRDNRASIISADTCIPVECTGMKDCKGKEIFEGDIIKSYGVTSVVEWEAFDDHQGYVIDTDDTELEIIGNIFENPEMVKKG